MFGSRSRRHRPSNPPLTAATANPNAATAAAAVFKRHESNPSLSASAAAAALRARPTTPTRVADVQTKRTMRRSASSFSDDTPPVPALPRDVDATTRQAAARSANTARMSGAPVRLASQKLASGEAPSWFGAAKMGDLGSVRRTDPAMASPPSSPLPAVVWDEDPAEGARPGSQASSINFSYPTRARRGSANVSPVVEVNSAASVPSQTNRAPAAPTNHQPAVQARHQSRGQPTVLPTRGPSTSSSADQALVYDANSRRMVRQADLLAIQQAQQTVPSPPAQPTGPKKKRAPQRAGSHLAAGTVSRTKTEPTSKHQPPNLAPHDQPQPAVRPLHPNESASPQENRVGGEPVDVVTDSPKIETKKVESLSEGKAVSLARSPVAPTSLSVASDASQFVVRRQPSVIQEGQEPGDAYGEAKAQAPISDALDAVPTRQRMQEGVTPEPRLPVTPPQTISSPSKHPPENHGMVQTDQKAKSDLIRISNDTKPKSGATEHGRVTHVSRERTHSNSPVRQAHFGPVQDNLTVKHSPPPRSRSPRKSAMKHSSSPDGASPSDDASEAPALINRESSVTRKKSVRVSFDDNAKEVGGESAPADSQIGSSSNVTSLYSDRHSWLGNSGRNSVLASFDDDIVMKPRPALPSFGSVRDRKPRESSPAEVERPLVRPRGEAKYTSPTPLLPSPPLGASSDHALGAIVSKGNERVKETSGQSEDCLAHREPLPPIVTSVEGTGYLSNGSDTSSMLSSEFDPPPPSPPKPVMEAHPKSPAGPQNEEHKEHKDPANCLTATSEIEVTSPQVAPMQQDMEEEPRIPAISISQPTPPSVATESSKQYFTDVPGGFPDDESDQSTVSAAKTTSEATIPIEPAEIPQQDKHLKNAPQPNVADTSSNSDSDIFSDAYEDLSDIEGEGFQSLDAVVERPVQQSSRVSAEPEQVSQRTPTQPVHDEKPQIETQEVVSAPVAVNSQPAEHPQDDWERAKAFWRSLTAEKRALLEKEALEEAGIEGDRDEEQPETKPKKKKTVERKNSERKALAVQMAQQMMAQQTPERTTHPDRSYMIKSGERWTGEGELANPTMRKSMRVDPQQQAPTAPVAGPRLRKSMRVNGSGATGHEPRTAETTTMPKRPESYPAALPPPSTGHRRSATQVEQIPPSLRRRGSTGSESSFKRSRSSKGQGFGFRHSMRPTSPRSTVSENHTNKRFSLRTLSPAGSVSPPVTQMRTTLRGSSAVEKRSNGIRMPSFSLSYGGGKKNRKGSSRASSGKAFSSRLADSSDEEGSGAGFESGFRSRFEDSSEDEPVVPIPALLSGTTSHSYPVTDDHHLRKESSVASTALPEELEDSSEVSQDVNARLSATEANGTDNNNSAARSAPITSTTTKNTLRRARSGKGQLLPASQAVAPLPSSSPSQPVDGSNEVVARPSRRNSIFSVLRPRRHRKKDNNTSTSTTGVVGRAGKIGRPDISESAARRDTRLERSIGQLAIIRSRRGGGSDDDEPDMEEEEGAEEENNGGKYRAGVMAPSPLSSPSSPPSQKQRSSRLQKRWSGGGGPGSGSVPISTVSSSSPRPPVVADDSGGDGGNAGTAAIDMLLNDNGGGIRDEDGHGHDVVGGDGAFAPAARHQQAIRRTTIGSSLSSNLGTRTLSGSGGGGGGGGGGFYHLHPRRRVSSVGMDVGGGSGGGSVDGSVMEGSLAGASSTTRRKRFGALRKILRLDD
ncbi:hypothetical protein C7999DRAFT_15234 [Corynascus novoguineensis]|uniref:Uncharacterized protein n=1 Tax=Corynascus novoguineensis TaxID=1126955 RepID=A0AAN7CQW5_9PEZI|nr:hypothetical protein C7999DRAFT_15234 [Corynascus novoguineensis]